MSALPTPEEIARDLVAAPKDRAEYAAGRAYAAVREALLAEAKRHEDAIVVAQQHGDDGEHHRLSAADLRQIAARIPGGTP
ncbi:MAG TPA: hypothetical protein VLT47_11145 [Anaeromyxobacteraceae bacterium]|nr:hypothetical protein [Anaeromyxobacteraceae bacterium]